MSANRMRLLVNDINTTTNNIVNNSSLSILNYININDSDHSTGFITAMSAAIADNKSIYMPPGTYYLSEVQPLSGMHIIAQKGAVIKAVGSTGAIFKDAAQGTAMSVIRIIGGTWNDCDYVFQRTNTTSLIHSSFEEMACTANIAAFFMQSSIQNVWKKNTFGGARAIQFSGSVSNINHIEDCKFQALTNWPIESQGQGETTANASLSITNCWFEDNTKGAIYLHDSVNGVTIESCYFEDNSQNQSNSEIEIDTDNGGKNRNIVVKNCYFANPNAAAAAAGVPRILMTGGSHIKVYDCHIALADTHVFINNNANNIYHSEFYNNYIGAQSGNQTYQQRILADNTNAPYSWSTFPGSGNTAMSDLHMRYNGKITADKVLGGKFSLTGTVTSEYSASFGEFVKVDPTAGQVEIWLPTNDGLTMQEIAIKNVSNSTNNIVIHASGSETIDGVNTKTLAASRASTRLIYDAAATDWMVLD